MFDAKEQNGKQSRVRSSIWAKKECDSGSILQRRKWIDQGQWLPNWSRWARDIARQNIRTSSFTWPTALCKCKELPRLISKHNVMDHIVGCRCKALDPFVADHLYSVYWLISISHWKQVDIRIRVKGGGRTAQIYAIRQAIAKALVAYYQKCMFTIIVWRYSFSQSIL